MCDAHYTGVDEVCYEPQREYEVIERMKQYYG